MESIQLEHENVIKLVLDTLWDRVEERRFSNEGKNPMGSKELNAETYEVKFSCPFCRVAVRGTYLSTFPLSPPKNQTAALK